MLDRSFLLKLGSALREQLDYTNFFLAPGRRKPAADNLACLRIDGNPTTRNSRRFFLGISCDESHSSPTSDAPGLEPRTLSPISGMSVDLQQIQNARRPPKGIAFGGATSVECQRD